MMARFTKKRERQYLVSTADLTEIIAAVRDHVPREAAPEREISDRRQFLKDTLGASEGALVFERVLNGDELQPVAYLERGMIAARAVCRIVLKNGVMGTGFQVAPGVILTNNHVIESAAAAAGARAEFGFETDLADHEVAPSVFRFRPADLFFTSVPLDFSVVAFEPIAANGTPAHFFPVLPTLETSGKASTGEWLTIVQHPRGERKQLCVRENQLLERTADYLRYTTDTDPGSSGSPVFNNDWYVVALHHAGVPARRDGRIQTIDGRDFVDGAMSQDLIKWVANQGIRASRIAQTLRAALPSHKLLQPLYAATPESARIVASGPVAPHFLKPAENQTMDAPRNVTIPVQVTVTVTPDGRVIQAVPAAPESFVRESLQDEPDTPLSQIDLRLETNHAPKKGYQPAFIGNGGLRVELPQMGPGLAAMAAPLLQPEGANRNVLHYDGYSVVVHKDRKLAIFSAANVSEDGCFRALKRPAVKFARDDRILPEHQLLDRYYGRETGFDRGHLTRAEDMQYGTNPKEAQARATDTFWFTNCVPQQRSFNQTLKWWQGLEQHLLEKAVYEGNLRRAVFTGPVFYPDDPEYKKFQYPVEFWKVLAAQDDKGKLFAIAFLVSQRQAIREGGIEAIPISDFKGWQVPVREIEGLTNLRFMCGSGGKTSLRSVDPLENETLAQRKARQRRQLSERESIGPSAPDTYVPLSSYGDMVT